MTGATALLLETVGRLTKSEPRPQTQNTKPSTPKPYSLNLHPKSMVSGLAWRDGASSEAASHGVQAWSNAGGGRTHWFQDLGFRGYVV